MIKKFILGLSMVGLLWGCNKAREEQLQTEVDSLRTELQESQQTAQTLQDVGVMIDSIDARRQLLRTDMVEGTRVNYRERLESISSYIKETQTKIDELEKSAKQARVYAGTIRRLKADLENTSKQLAALETELQTVRSENTSLSRRVVESDSIITVNQETLKTREESLAQLETKVEDLNTQAQNDMADAYFAQAKALEEAADRTKFAPKKKKETQREALELYKMALSLGKTEAQAKVSELEKDIG